MNIRLFLVSRS